LKSTKRSLSPCLRLIRNRPAKTWIIIWKGPEKRLKPFCSHELLFAGIVQVVAKDKDILTESLIYQIQNTK